MSEDLRGASLQNTENEVNVMTALADRFSVSGGFAS